MGDRSVDYEIWVPELAEVEITTVNGQLQRRYSHPVEGLRSDQTVILTAIESAKAYPDSLRRVSYFDAATNKRLKFLTNNFALPALTIARIKSRWQIELFFKWIKSTCGSRSSTVPARTP